MQNKTPRPREFFLWERTNAILLKMKKSMKPNIGQGDRGTTQVFGATKKCSKDTPQIKAYGTVDELNSWVGFVRSQNTFRKLDKILIRIQKELFVAGAMLSRAKNTGGSPRLSRKDIDNVEHLIKEYEGDLPPLKNFILPGGDLLAALCDICRTVCRRAERHVVTSVRHEKSAPMKKHREIILAYLNRLSDLFFTIERWINHKKHKKEVKWIGIKKK